jgi:hypothetical protein
VSSVKEEGALFHLPRLILVRLSSELLPSELEVGFQPTYVEIQSDIFMIIRAITGRGIRPEKPEGAERVGFSDELWRMVKLCWQQDRNARPVIEDILSCLNDTGVLGCEITNAVGQHIHRRSHLRPL